MSSPGLKPLEMLESYIEEGLTSSRTCDPPIDISQFNFTSYDYERPHGYFKQFNFKDYCKIIFSLLVIIVSVIGNIGVLFSSTFNRSIRHTIHIYLSNLAIADLFISIFCMIVFLINNLTYPLFVLGPIVCKLNAFTQMTSLTSSVLTLSAISCDRFIAIMYPLRVRVTKQRTKAVITVIWIISLAVSTPFVIVRKHLEFQWRNFVETNCQEIWPPHTHYDPIKERCLTTYPWKKYYYTFVTIALFFLPIVIMTTAYALIIWKLWITKLPGESNAASICAQHRAKKKVIKMACIVLLVFVCCWAPLQITLIYSEFIHSPSERGQLPGWFKQTSYLATFVAYSNSAINPIIYGGFDKTFRQAFGTFISCHTFNPVPRVIRMTTTPGKPKLFNDETGTRSNNSGNGTRLGSTFKTSITQETDAL
ncbi:QRFP-like peptide receptor isoform X2 [Panonychus citri]|uniref:QRFP-like peptide receptor isoform X2 n=1 Tax=Panonychus citri TaxID=50023 RepID=UPI0023076EBE|nr:QRFP-like peptide receptor isoform X2 [Panonychus citri]